MNELSREFTDHLAAVVQRGGGNIDDMTDEVSKFALQGNNILLLKLSSNPLSLFPSLSPSYPPSPSLSAIRSILLCVQ